MLCSKPLVLPLAWLVPMDEEKDLSEGLNFWDAL